MTNPFEIETLTVQYTSAMDLLLQQMESKLRGTVMTGNHVGREASPVQQIAPLEFKQVGARFSPIVLQNGQYARRWVSPNDRDCGTGVDTFDMLKTIVNPQSALSQTVTAAAMRFYDDVIIGSAFASARVGVDSSSMGTETWPASTYLVADTFDSAASSGLTFSKIIEGRRILEHYQNDLDREAVTLVIGSQQKSDLLKQMEVINRDYSSSDAANTGRLPPVLGCNIIGSERLNTSSSNSLRNCIMFVKSGMYLGIWKDMSVDFSQNKNLTGHPWILYAMLSAGATRLQLGKVIQINAADTTSADPTAP